jgi:hypothetical protein
LLVLSNFFNFASFSFRETTTPRTSTEQLLVSTAAERAVAQFDNAEEQLKGKKVFVDDHLFDSVDKPYAVSAVRHYCSEHGAILLPAATEMVKFADGKETAVPAERILEIRNGALGLEDKGWGFGIPSLPLPIPQTSISTASPPLYFFFRGKQEGWAKFQIWIYDPRQNAYVAKSKDLWGHTYYSKWWILFIGPFDWSNDVYPDESISTAVK